MLKRRVGGSVVRFMTRVGLSSLRLLTSPGQHRDADGHKRSNDCADQAAEEFQLDLVATASCVFPSCSTGVHHELDVPRRPAS